MSAKLAAGAALATLAMMLAGCTGGFQLQQTEPFRVQLDGAPEMVRVEENDAEPQRVLVENSAGADTVEVQVTVKQVSDEPVTVMVIVQDSETNETLATRQVTVGAVNGTGTNTTTNTTGPIPPLSPTNTTTQDGMQGQTVNQNIVVNVKGKGNLVVITEAQQGEAEVDISARQAGSGSVQQGDTNTNTTTTGPWG